MKKKRYLFDEELLETEKEEKMKDSRYSFDQFKKSFGEAFSKEIKIESYIDEENEDKVLSLLKKHSLKGKLVDKDNDYSIEGKVENIARFSQEFVNNDDLYSELERELKRLKLIDSNLEYKGYTIQQSSYGWIIRKNGKFIAEVATDDEAYEYIDNLLKKDSLKKEVEEKEESKKEKDELTFIDEDNQIFSEDEIKNLKWLAKQDIMDKVIELLDKNFSDEEEKSEETEDGNLTYEDEKKEESKKDQVKDSYSLFNNHSSYKVDEDEVNDQIINAWKNRKVN